jgi:hypothetical protein
MAIKKFSKFVAEAPAADYIAPKDDDAEVKGYKPRSKGEEDFANQHMVQKTDYYAVPGQDHVFNGSVKEVNIQPNNGEGVQKQGASDVNQPQGGGDSKRSADKSQGDKIATVKEEVELDEGKVMDGLKKIVDKKQAGTIKFENGKTLKVDMTTANAMLNLHKKINDKNKAKMADQIEKSPEVFMKLMDVAFGGK